MMMLDVPPGVKRKTVRLSYVILIYQTNPLTSLFVFVDILSQSFASISLRDNVELRTELLNLGEKPGPVDDNTSAAYQAYLAKVQNGPQPKGNKQYKGIMCCTCACRNNM